MTSNSYFIHIHLTPRPRMENHFGNYLKDHQLQLNKLIQIISFIVNLLLLMLHCSAEYSMLNIQKILENNKKEFKFVIKLLKLKWNLLYQMINSQSKWQNKLTKMKLQNNLIKCSKMKGKS